MTHTTDTRETKPENKKQMFCVLFVSSRLYRQSVFFYFLRCCGEEKESFRERGEMEVSPLVGKGSFRPLWKKGALAPHVGSLLFLSSLSLSPIFSSTSFSLAFAFLAGDEILAASALG